MILEISHNLTLDSFILMEKHDDIKGLSKLFVVIQNNLFQLIIYLMVKQLSECQLRGAVEHRIEMITILVAFCA